MYVLFTFTRDVTFRYCIRRWKFIQRNDQQKECDSCHVHLAIVYMEGVNLIPYKACESCWLDLCQGHEAVPVTPREASGIF